MEIKRKGLAHCPELQHLYWSCHWRKIKEKLAVDAEKYGMFFIVKLGTERRMTALDEVIYFMEQEADVLSAYTNMNGGYPASHSLDYLVYIAQCISTAIKYPKDQVPTAEDWGDAMFIKGEQEERV